LQFLADQWNTCAMTLCFGFGQTIDTALSVPGTISGSGAAAITIREAPPRANVDAPLYARDGAALVFSAPEVATYRCEPAAIEIAPCPGSQLDSVTGLLIATALPAVLWMQGGFMLHAAGVVLPGAGSAVAIVGPSGAGKSLLAAQLLERGARLLGDDSLALELTATGVIASGLPGGLHRATGPESARAFDAIAEELAVRSAPLGAIIVLVDRTDRFAATPLNPPAALEQILAHQHRPRIPAALGRSGAVLAQAAQIAARVPVQLWRRTEEQLTLSEEELSILRQAN
jgi:hypothetical protein